MNGTETVSEMMGGGLQAIGGAPTVAIIGERRCSLSDLQRGCAYLLTDRNRKF